MGATKRLAAGLATMAVLVATAAAYAGLIVLPQNGSGSSKPATEPLRVSGSVPELFPGVASSLRLTVRNPAPYPVRLTSIEVTAADASPSCSGAHVVAGALPRPRLITPRGRRRVAVPIGLLASAPDECRRQAFPLTFTADAVRTKVARR